MSPMTGQGKVAPAPLAPRLDRVGWLSPPTPYKYQGKTMRIEGRGDDILRGFEGDKGIILEEGKQKKKK